jgi:hypothetical protein
MGKWISLRPPLIGGLGYPSLLISYLYARTRRGSTNLRKTMPLFNALSGDRANGQLQEPICPRCRSDLRVIDINSTGEGIGIRKVEGDYDCPCGYSVEIIERYPIIQKEQPQQAFQRQEGQEVEN